MTKRQSFILWAAIIATIIGGSVLSAVWPKVVAETASDDHGAVVAEKDEEGELITIEVERYLLVPDLMSYTKGLGINALDNLTKLNGDIAPLALVGILTAIVVGGTFALVAPFFALSFLDKMVLTVKNEDEYKTGTAALAQKEKEFVAAKKESNPPGEMPSHKMPRWSIISTILLVLTMLWFGALALAENFYPTGEEVSSFAGFEYSSSTGVVRILLILALVVMGVLFYFRPKTLDTIDESDNMSMSWGGLWVIASGLLFFTVGLGLMFWVRGV